MINLFTADINGLTNDECYSAIVDFAGAQPNESNRHDFKSIWTNETVKDVAAFGNTFGGLLIIGVEKSQDDSQAKAIGVTSSSELTTRIASAIATNISPTPSYDIAECHGPGDTDKRFCIVRVRSSTTLYLVTKKGLPPVWIRNADQTIAADAAQLRNLIDREGRSQDVLEQTLLDRAEGILENMIIGHSYPDNPHWTVSAWQRSATYFKITLIPAEKKWIPLDVREETKFVRLVHERYRRIESNLASSTDPAARDGSNRSADFYEYRWYHRRLEHESRWRIRNQLDVAHATQIKYEDNWSLVDVVMYTILLLKLGAKWWTAFNYFGDGMLVATLAVPGLQLRRGASNQFVKLFGPGEGDFAMDADVLTVQPYPQSSVSQAYVHVRSATLLDDLPRIVTSIMNPLLRSVGHAVDWEKFEDGVRNIVRGQS
ncbi:MAG: AlbA family DNA-binding domain-containing protein [Candidatus Acidiferrales bacterium]